MSGEDGGEEEGEFFGRLRRVDVVSVAQPQPSIPGVDGHDPVLGLLPDEIDNEDEEEEDEEEKEQRRQAALRLQAFCSSLKLKSVVGEKRVVKDKSQALSKAKAKGMGMGGRIPVRSVSFHDFGTGTVSSGGVGVGGEDGDEDVVGVDGASNAGTTTTTMKGRPRGSSVACFVTGDLVDDPLEMEMDDGEFEEERRGVEEERERMKVGMRKGRAMTLH
ncbi:hypothetical protein CVT24_012478 [Panaeolus cyanescens]|uniref:Uncharacterized protein n=1 Tax=Panaeolus cyanescens TaxID=181874 RepID=A0A409YK54_9AGAR|nr:hypothetical protein CVT24_012478 [Panaeolus cyanescens]